jgi:pimeloyl-ACP methyl ester carboxylesterase
LVQSPEAEMRRLAEFLELPFEPSLLTPHATGRMTDGVKRGGAQVGDPNFSTRKAINPLLAHVDPSWRTAHPLTATTLAVATALGYTHRGEKEIEWLAGCREYWLESQRGRLSICEWGPATGETILLLHGWQDQSASWAGVARELASSGYRVLAPDLRQHGRHREDEAQRPTTFDFVADAYALLCAKGIARAHVIGHSFGSIVAAMLAAAMSGDDDRHIASLTLAEPILPEDTTTLTPADSIRRNLRGIRWRIKTSDEMTQSTQSVVARYDSIDAIAKRLQHGFPCQSDETLRLLAARVAEPDGERFQCPTLANAGARLVAALRDIERQQFMAVLRQLDMPLLWLRGTNSKQRRERDELILHAALPSARITELNAGHNLHVEAAHGVAGAVVAFLKTQRCDRVNEAHSAFATDSPTVPTEA